MVVPGGGAGGHQRRPQVHRGSRWPPLTHPPLPQAHNKTYAWNLMLHEVPQTIPTLWRRVQAYAQQHPQAAAPDNGLRAFVDVTTGDFSGCHFW